MGTFARTPGSLAANEMVKNAIPKDITLTPKAEETMNQLLQARIDGKPFDSLNLSLKQLDNADLRALEANVRQARQETMEVTLSPSADTREKGQAQDARREWDNALASVQQQQMMNERNDRDYDPLATEENLAAGYEPYDRDNDAEAMREHADELAEGDHLDRMEAEGIEKATKALREPIAVELTEEQTKLLLSAEYPNDGAAQKTALNAIYEGADEVSVMNESVLLDYSHDQKTFFAELEQGEKPALDAKLTQLQADRERDQQKQAQDPRQRERNAERSR